MPSTIEIIHVSEEQAFQPKLCINEKLPTELLGSILGSLFSDTSNSLPFPPSYDQILEHFKRHPLLGAMIACRTWYDIIQTTPTFWTTVGLGPEGAIKSKSDEESSVGTFASPEQLRSVLEKSGTLPLHVTVLPRTVGDFRAVCDALGPCTHRLELLNLVVPGLIQRNEDRGMDETDLETLLKSPLPRLKWLHIQVGRFTGDTPWSENSLPFEMDAPSLREISSHNHLLLPRIPSSLIRLSLVDLYHTQIHPPIELHQLLELRLTRCNPRNILPLFSTPSLRILAVQDAETWSGSNDNIPVYLNLQELQWSDNGPDTTLEMLVLHSPNVTTYSNYTSWEERELDLRAISVGPTILGSSTIPWPKVEEARFDVASCNEIRKALEIMPKLKRVRILRDPIERLELELERQVQEKALLAKLKEELEIII